MRVYEVISTNSEPRFSYFPNTLIPNPWATDWYGATEHLLPGHKENNMTELRKNNNNNITL